MGYDIISKLGEGWYANVYLINCQGRLYAGKKLKRMASTAHRSELEVLAALRGVPYMSQLRGVSRNGMIVTDYFSRGDLESLLLGGRVLQENVARGCLAEVVAAVRTLHGAGFVHGDVKPGNILVDAQGHLVLADFGKSAMIAPGREPSSDWLDVGRRVACRLVVGRVPGADARETRRTLLLRTRLSPAAKTFLLGLLEPEPNFRLGDDSVTNHEFFRGIDWRSVMNRENCPPLAVEVLCDDLAQLRLT
ncbi:uncharacterized protein LOC134541234 [Bacillus rossius redtenbacheri]|uniref:uncharacterized protein LOC134541234 n=1 Tax=Bacillus rossius redtenbacheri TaxID=93214 RepID=UPI002FDD4155